jgi:hypothetical protein
VVDLKNLFHVALAGPFTFWHYRTSDEYGAVVERGYWYPCSSMMRKGDWIACQSHGENSLLVVTAADKITGEVHVTTMQSVPT